MNWLNDLVSKFSELRIEVVIVVAVLLVAAIIGIIIFGKKDRDTAKKGWTPQQLAIGALCISIAFILSYFRLFKMPQGGSITLASMLPIMIFAYFFGIKKGLIVGLAYGCLQIFQDLFAVHWLQVVLDYGVAFMALAFAGLFKKKIVPGMIIAGVIRFVAHALSGWIFFAEYAPEGQHALVYSMAYNSFVFADMAICIVVVLLPPVKKFINGQKDRLTA